MNPTRQHLEPYHYISTDAELASLVCDIAGEARLAVDTEADSLHHYREKVCLIQITAGGRDFVVDPLAGFDLSPLTALLAAKPLVFHGADYDLRMLRRSLGVKPREPVSDTMLAAQLLGYDRLGLAALVERHFGVALSKRGQKSDWSRRPLTSEQLEYARLDTHYLPELADILVAELKSKGRAAWFSESCEAVVCGAMEQDRAGDGEEWRIKGSRLLSRRELAFLKEIWNWREDEARHVDLPRFKILVDEQLMAIVRWASAHPGKSVTKGPRLPRNCLGKRLSALEKAVARAESAPEKSYPEQPRPGKRLRSEGDCSRRIELLRKGCSEIAIGLGIAPSTLAPRASLAAIAREMPLQVEGIMAAGKLLRWQAETIAPIVGKMKK